jgi:hypothetical protein
VTVLSAFTFVWHPALESGSRRRDDKTASHAIQYANRVAKLHEVHALPPDE